MGGLGVFKGYLKWVDTECEKVFTFLEVIAYKDNKTREIVVRDVEFCGRNFGTEVHLGAYSVNGWDTEEGGKCEILNYLFLEIFYLQIINIIFFIFKNISFLAFL